MSFKDGSNIDDFNEYVNGDWIKNFTLPPDESEWGTFKEISDEVSKRLINILSEKTGDITNILYDRLLNYDNNTDRDRIELICIKNIISLLRPENFESNKRSNLGYVIGLLDVLAINPLFNIAANEDPKNTDIVKFTMFFPTLTLPEKIYYIDEGFAEYLEEFRKHIDTILRKSEEIDPEISNYNFSSDSALNCEISIAKSLKSAENTLDIDSMYARLPVKSFIETIGLCGVQFQTGFDCSIAQDLWIKYFSFITTINSDKTIPLEEIVVYDVPYFQKLTTILSTSNIEEILSYLAYNILSKLCKMTVKSFDESYYLFFDKKLKGIKSDIRRDRKVSQFLDGMYGEIIGQEYTKRYFNEESKNVVLSMINNIIDQMKRSIINSEILSINTKEHALKKIQYLRVKIGYPDIVKDYSQMIKNIKNKLDSNRLGQYVCLTDIFIYTRFFLFSRDVLGKIGKLGKDINKWSMNPQDVNAYYSPQMNEICFPAGILSEPVFNKDISLKTDSVEIMKIMAGNYGAIGSVIAHEITHGFDDQGRKYDYDGNLVNWWTDADLSKFKGKTQKMIDQYDSYFLTVNDQKIKINGRLTLSENLADLGGVVLSYRAFIEDMKKRGFVPDNDIKKIFFESYALLWRKKTSPEKVLSKIFSDTHSPSNFRVWILRNMDEFYDVYNIDEKSKMYLKPEDRVRIF